MTSRAGPPSPDACLLPFRGCGSLVPKDVAAAQDGLGRLSTGTLRRESLSSEMRFPGPASLSCGETDVRGLGDPGAPVFLALREGGG